MTMTDENPIVAINLAVYPTYIVKTYERLLRHRKRSILQIRNEKNLSANQVDGELSKKAVRRLTNAVNWLVASAKPKTIIDHVTKKKVTFRVNFLTLTLPSTNGNMSDREFKSKYLKRFLQSARYHYGLRNYVWKCETQQNGNIHVHITTDTYMHWRWVRDTWNHIIDQTSYMDSFEKNHGHRDPNSTDIHAVKKIKNLSAYICKYFAKNEEGRRKIQGRIWFVSQSLSRSKVLNLHLDPADSLGVLRRLFAGSFNWKKIESKPNAFGETRTVGEICFLSPHDWLGKISGHLKIMYENHLRLIRGEPPELFALPHYPLFEKTIGTTE